MRWASGFEAATAKTSHAAPLPTLLAARFLQVATHGSAAVQKLVTWFCTGLRSLLSGQLL
jgi:Icc-related predicted phosphoesterase